MQGNQTTERRGGDRERMELGYVTSGSSPFVLHGDLGPLVKEKLHGRHTIVPSSKVERSRVPTFCVLAVHITGIDQIG